MSPTRNLASSQVVLAVDLGSRTVEMLVIRILSIHGPRASRLAKVGGNSEINLYEVCCDRNISLNPSL